MAVSLVYIHKKQQQPLAKNNPKFFSQITSIKLRTFDAKSWAVKFWLRIPGSGIVGCRLWKSPGQGHRSHPWLCLCPGVRRLLHLLSAALSQIMSFSGRDEYDPCQQRCQKGYSCWSCIVQSLGSGDVQHFAGSCCSHVATLFSVPESPCVTCRWYHTLQAYVRASWYKREN